MTDIHTEIREANEPFDLRSQLIEARGHARFLLREHISRGPLTSILVYYPLQPDIPPRISLIGESISWGSVSIWVSNGAIAIKLETIS